MEDDFLSRQDSEENSFTDALLELDALIKDVNMARMEEGSMDMTDDQKDERVPSPKLVSWVDFEGLINALDALRMDIQKHFTQDEEVQDLNHLISALDLLSLIHI